MVKILDIGCKENLDDDEEKDADEDEENDDDGDDDGDGDGDGDGDDDDDDDDDDADDLDFDVMQLLNYCKKEWINFSTCTNHLGTVHQRMQKSTCVAGASPNQNK